MPAALDTLLITSKSEDQTAKLGRALALHLAAGDTLLLDGPIGAGKTHLARAIIRALLTEDEDIPSPTYTLVQTYQTPEFEVWHADLYRLSDSSELIELGLDEAIETAAVIIEWPDRLPKDMAHDASLLIAIDPAGDTRELTVTTRAPKWRAALEAFVDD